MEIDQELPLNDDAEAVRLAKQMASQLRPDWTDRQLLHQWFTEGISNKILCMWEPSNEDDRILFRIFGCNTELLIDRATELHYMELLRSKRVGARVLAKFRNGLVYTFVPGEVLTTDSVRHPGIATEIARSMVELHCIKDPGDASPKPVLFSKMSNWLRVFPETFQDSKLQKTFESEIPSKNKLQHEVELYENLAKKSTSPIVLCHNDLLLKNIVFNQKTGRAQFIDYEYTAFNFQAFDIANHFAEFAGVDELDFSLYPDTEFRHWWLKNYATFWHSANSLPPPSDRDVQSLFDQVDLFSPLPHLFWGIWAVIQAKNSTIDFDFLQYGVDKLGEYFQMKKKRFPAEVESLPPFLCLITS